MTDELNDLTDAMTKLEEAVDQGPEPVTRTDIVPIDPPETTDYVSPWGRQLGESDLHWVLFEHYRDSGLGRSYLATVRWFNDELGGLPSQKTIGKSGVAKIAQQNEWQDRIKGYDDDNERRYQIARAEATRAMVDRHGEQIETALDAMMVPIEALNEALAEDPDLVKRLAQSSPQKLLQYANSAARTLPNLMSAERLARGMPTEVVSGTVDVQHTVRVEREHIAEILDALDRTGSFDVGGTGGDSGEIIDAEVVEVYPLPADDHE